MSGHGTHHTGSGGYQDDTKMEQNASKWQMERDQDPDVQEAVSVMLSCRRHVFAEHVLFLTAIFHTRLP